MTPNEDIIRRLRAYVSNPFNIKHFPRCVAERKKQLENYGYTRDNRENEGFGMF